MINRNDKIVSEKVSNKVNDSFFNLLFHLKNTKNALKAFYKLLSPEKRLLILKRL